MCQQVWGTHWFNARCLGKLQSAFKHLGSGGLQSVYWQWISSFSKGEICNNKTSSSIILFSLELQIFGANGPWRMHFNHWHNSRESSDGLSKLGKTCKVYFVNGSFSFLKLLCVLDTLTLWTDYRRRNSSASCWKLCCWKSLRPWTW